MVNNKQRVQNEQDKDKATVRIDPQASGGAAAGAGGAGGGAAGGGVIGGPKENTNRKNLGKGGDIANEFKSRRPAVGYGDLPEDMEDPEGDQGKR